MNDTLADQERMRAARRYQAWQFRLARPALGRRVLEVGCGIGNFTRHLLAAPGTEAILALDAEADCIAALRQSTGDPRLETRVAEAAPTVLRALEPWGADTVVCLNVLEHLDEDAAALAAMIGALRPGGAVVLQVPALAALYGSLDRELGHRRRYRRARLRHLAASAGARVERLGYMNAIGAVGWWINARLLARSRQSAAQIAIFDRFIVPWAAAWEDRVPPPLGQSLFAVLRKSDRPAAG